MISLLKHIDSWRDTLAESSVAAYRAALLAMGDCGERAVPGIGREMNQKLAEIHQMLGQTVTPEMLTDASDSVQKELAIWADLACSDHADHVREIREIVAVVGRTGESVARRDEKYSQQLGALNGRLQALAELNDLPVIRRSILESTRELKAYVEKMAEDSQDFVGKLLGEVAEYRVRLEESERRSATDPLTGLSSRREFESQMDALITAKKPFCLLMADLNDFKSVNDRHGHLAGDDLLRQFAGELRVQFRPVDLVGRWGGDEFVAIITASRSDAEACVNRIRKWVLGDYKVKAGEREVKIPVQAAIGLAQWNGRESATELMARADAASYVAKTAAKTLGYGSPGDSTRELDLAAAKR